MCPKGNYIELFPLPIILITGIYSLSSVVQLYRHFLITGTGGGGGGYWTMITFSSWCFLFFNVEIIHLKKKLFVLFILLTINVYIVHADYHNRFTQQIKLWTTENYQAKNTLVHPRLIWKLSHYKYIVNKIKDK